MMIRLTTIEAMESNHGLNWLLAAPWFPGHKIFGEHADDYASLEEKMRKALERKGYRYQPETLEHKAAWRPPSHRRRKHIKLRLSLSEFSALKTFVVAVAKTKKAGSEIYAGIAERWKGSNAADSNLGR